MTTVMLELVLCASLISSPEAVVRILESKDGLSKSSTLARNLHWRGDEEVFNVGEVLMVTRQFVKKFVSKKTAAKRQRVSEMVKKAVDTATRGASMISQAVDSEMVLSRNTYVDHNGNGCDICGWPDASKLAPGQKYKKFRTDCGKKREGAKIPEEVQREEKLVEMNKDGTNAFCELNIRKSCADAIVNRDYMYFAKSLDFSKIRAKARVQRYDGQYCLKNGWLEPKLVDLVHSTDFDALQAEGRRLCETKYERYNWREMTLATGVPDFQKNATLANGLPNAESGVPQKEEPTQTEAERLAAVLCGLGDVSCDMAYCAYTYCAIGDGTTKAYDECPGWDPVHGMRIRSTV